MKNHPVRTGLFHVDRRTDRHDEANILLFAILRMLLKTAIFRDINISVIAKNQDRRPSLVEVKRFVCFRGTRFCEKIRSHAFLK